MPTKRQSKVKVYSASHIVKDASLSIAAEQVIILQVSLLDILNSPIHSTLLFKRFINQIMNYQYIDSFLNITFTISPFMGSGVTMTMSLGVPETPKNPRPLQMNVVIINLYQIIKHFHMS